MAPSSSTESVYHFGKYQIQGHLGTGGMGAVYKAWDAENQRSVALKILLPEAAAIPQRLERFRREARLGARLSQENIVGLYEFGNVKGTFYLAMEYVAGINLYDWIEQHGPLGPEQACAILKQMLLALDHAHHHRVVHRDIKPANILIAEGPHGLVAKLADLGVSRRLEDDNRMTMDGNTLGTVDYMAPEQARDPGAADSRSDLYSLGCTLFHMLSGKPPFPDGTLIERVFKHAQARPPELTDFNPAVPEWLQAICERMMAKSPAQRFQTPRELLAVLGSPEELPATAESLPVLGAAQRSPRDPEALSVDDADGGSAATMERTPSQNLQRQIAAGQFARASQVLVTGNYSYGMPLLVSCCRIDPTNLLYRQALREVQRTRPRSNSWFAQGRDFVLANWAKMRLLLAQRAQNHERVLELGEEILNRQPWDVPTQLAMAQAAESAGWLGLAQWTLEQAVEADTVHVAVHKALGNLLEKRSAFTKAIKHWKKVKRADPHDCEAATKIRNLTALDTMQRGQYQALFATTKKPRRRRTPEEKEAAAEAARRK